MCVHGSPSNEKVTMRGSTARGHRCIPAQAGDYSLCSMQGFDPLATNYTKHDLNQAKFLGCCL